MRHPPIMLLAVLALAACQAAPAGPAEPTAAPARRVVTPPPTGAPEFATPKPGAGPIGRIQRVQPWLRLEDGVLIYTFMLLDKAGDPVFFASKNPVKVAWRFATSEGGEPVASGDAAMAEDSLKFELAGVSAERLYVTWSAQLPDGRLLSGEGWVTVEGGKATPEPG